MKVVPEYLFFGDPENKNPANVCLPGFLISELYRSRMILLTIQKMEVVPECFYRESQNQKPANLTCRFFYYTGEK